jgi:hypothetical protein
MSPNTTYSIHIPSAFFIEYRESDHVMKIDIDLRDTIPVLSHSAISSWEPPHENELISDEKRRQILGAVVNYLHDDRKFSFELQGGSLVPSRSFK